MQLHQDQAAGRRDRRRTDQHPARLDGDLTSAARARTEPPDYRDASRLRPWKYRGRSRRSGLALSEPPEQPIDLAPCPSEQDSGPELKLPGLVQAACPQLGGRALAALGSSSTDIDRRLHI